MNINVSILLSSEGAENSNSKSSVAMTYSSDSKKKYSLASESRKSKNTPGGNNTINTINTNGTFNTNSNKTHNSNSSKMNYETPQIHKNIIAKRKILYDKQNNTQKNESISDEDELLDQVEYQNTVPNCKNLKITNITNIIVNGKNLGPKSFDLKTIKSASGADPMMRDMKSLHLITQRALSTHSKNNPVDSIDDERKSFLNFRNIHSKKELFIDDNSDLAVCKNTSNCSEQQSHSFANESKNKPQIINIININNNYNIGNISLTKDNMSNQHFNSSYRKSFNTVNVNNYKKHHNNYNNFNTYTNDPVPTPSDSVRSNVSNKTTKRIVPPKNNSNNKSIKEIIKSCKDNKPKTKFIKLGK